MAIPVKLQEVITIIIKLQNVRKTIDDLIKIKQEVLKEESNNLEVGMYIVLQIEYIKSSLDDLN